MTTHIKAPPARLVNAFDGKKAPDVYFGALSEANDFCKELDGLRESQTRVQELEAENADLRAHLGQANETIEALTWARSQAMVDADIQARKVALLSAENTDLAERLDSLANAHRITLAALAEARRGNTEPWHGRATGAL